MSNKIVFWQGITGASLFALASILGGLQFDNYDPISQYISESMAIDAPYGKILRYFGYIPSGILLTVFCFAALKKLPESKLTTIGFWGLGVFYGVATIIIGLFPCDIGCNKEFINPSASQLIHNLTGLLTYIFVPLSIILIGAGLRESKKYYVLSKIAGFCGSISFLFVVVLLSDPATNYAGLFQRIIEGIFIIWIIASSVLIKGNNQPGINAK